MKHSAFLRMANRFSFVIAVALLCSGMLFQNCSGLNYSNSETMQVGSSTALPASSAPLMNNQNAAGGGGNGDIFDGKPLDNLLRAGKCPDGTNVNARILYSSTGARLIRDMCRDLTPVNLAPKDVTLGLSQKYLLYKNHVFQDPLANASRVSLFCLGSQSAPSIRGEYVLTGTSSPIAHLITDSGYDSGLFPVDYKNINGNLRVVGTDGQGFVVELEQQGLSPATISVEKNLTGFNLIANCVDNE